MGNFTCESESRVSFPIIQQGPNANPSLDEIYSSSGFVRGVELGRNEPSPKLMRRSSSSSSTANKKKKNQVLLEGYVEAADDDDLSRTKSLTDEDLDELKGCLDLGFGFSYDEIPELCNTLPALELCYSMSQKFMDEHQKSPESTTTTTTSHASLDSVSSPIANWKISSPGDHPEDVKARLKFWAQAVACTVRLCS